MANGPLIDFSAPAGEKFKNFIFFDRPATNVSPSRKGFLSTLGDFMTSSGLALQGDVDRAEAFKRGRRQESLRAQEAFQERLRQQSEQDFISTLPEEQQQLARITGASPIAQARLQELISPKKPGLGDVLSALALPEDSRAAFLQSLSAGPESQFEVIPGKKGDLEIRETALAEGRRKGEIKAAEEKAVAEKKTTEALKGTRRMIESFSESREELQELFPNIGESNIEGLIERTGAGLFEKTGQLPKTTAFRNRLSVIANQQARDIEGGRVTDKDREVYANAMVDAMKFPDESNIVLASEALRDMQDKGANIDPVLDEFDNSPIDLLRNISANVRPSLEQEEITEENTFTTPSGISFTFEEVK